MVKSLVVFTELHSFLVNGDVGGFGLRPAAGVEVLYAVLFQLERFVRVPAEDALCVARPGMAQRSIRHRGSQAQPLGVQPLHQPRRALAAGIELLQGQKQGCEKSSQSDFIDCETIKLMAVDGQMPYSAETPLIFLVNL